MSEDNIELLSERILSFVRSESPTLKLGLGELPRPSEEIKPYFRTRLSARSVREYY